MALQDFGQKIGGARKDLRGDFQQSDIANFTHIERTKLVRKDMVWPTPDYVDLVEQQGYTREAAAAVKMIRDAFPACPVVRADISEEAFASACNRYIRALNVAKTAVDGCKTPSAIAEKLRSDMEVRTEIACPNGEVNLRKLTVDAGENLKHWNEGGMNMSVNERHEILCAFHYGLTGTLDRTTRNMLSKNPDWPNGTSLADKAIRKERASMVESLDGTGWRIAICGTIIPEKNYGYYERRSPFAAILGKSFPGKATADSALLKSVEDRYAADREEKKAKRDAVLGKSAANPSDQPQYRIGPDLRNMQNARGDDYLNDFGMRGGEYGLWVNQTERQEVLDRGYDGFCDMARVLEIDKNQISLGGSLAIAFGARGYGGTNAAAAHYEPARKVINLTKPHGEGNLAHEYAHAMDHHFGDRCREIGLPVQPEDGVFRASATKLKESDLLNIQPEFIEEARAIVGLSRAMREIWHFEKTFTQPEAIAKAKAELADVATRRDKLVAFISQRATSVLRYSMRPEDEQKRLVAACESIAASIEDPTGVRPMKAPARIVAELKTALGGKEDGMLHDIEFIFVRYASNVAMLTGNLDRALDPSYQDNPIVERGPTDYAKLSKKLDLDLGRKTDYHCLPREMFARATESAVEDLLNRERQQNPFLVSGSHSLAHPVGASRERNRDSLIPAIRAVARFIRPTAPTAAVSVTEAAHEPVAAAPADEFASREEPLGLPRSYRQAQGMMDFSDGGAQASTPKRSVGMDM